MSCCAVEGCQEPVCSVCTVPRRFPPVVRCGGLAPDGQACKYVKGHPGYCRGTRKTPKKKKR